MQKFSIKFYKYLIYIDFIDTLCEPVSLDPMSVLTNIALSGLGAAQTRLAVRAKNIVNASTPGYEPDQVAQISTNPGAAARVIPGRAGGYKQTGSPLGAGAAPAPNKVNLAAEIVDFKLAETSYKAALAVLKTADDLERSTLEILT